MDHNKADNEEFRNYIEGIKRFQKKGVVVLIDKKEAEEEDWKKITEVREDGAFYMTDYIFSEETERKLKEIHLDKVYYN